MSALKVILGKKYFGFKKSLQKPDLKTLFDRRAQLCLNFAKSCFKNPKFNDMFPKNKKTHLMELRNPEDNANTDTFSKSDIIYMQHLLNEDEEK